MSDINNETAYLFLFYTSYRAELNFNAINCYPSDYKPPDGWTGVSEHVGSVAEIRPFYEDEATITSDNGKLPFRFSDVICLTGPSATRDEMKTFLEKIFYELEGDGIITAFEVSEEWITH